LPRLAFRLVVLALAASPTVIVSSRADPPGRAWISEDRAIDDVARLEQLLRERYAYFDSADAEVIQPLLRRGLSNGISRRDFALQVAHALTHLNDGHTRLLFGESGVDQPALQPGRTPDPIPIDWRIRRHGIGHLALRAGMFAGDASRRSLRRALEDLRSTRAIVLDVRGNAGGSREPVMALLDFLISEHERPVVINVAALRSVRDDPSSDALEALRQRYLFPLTSPHWTPAERRFLAAAAHAFEPQLPVPRGRFSEWYVTLLRNPPGRAGTYEGPVVVLQDEDCASATELLLAALKGRPGITLMGARSRGGSGYPVRYVLPHSRLVVQLSSMVSFQGNGRLFTGTDPDILYDLSPTDAPRARTGEDPLLERALDLLSNRLNEGEQLRPRKPERLDEEERGEVPAP
jgi:hypothetical protein